MNFDDAIVMKSKCVCNNCYQIVFSTLIVTYIIEWMFELAVNIFFESIYKYEFDLLLLFLHHSLNVP
jgi:hypothetical protein